VGGAQAEVDPSSRGWLLQQD